MLVNIVPQCKTNNSNKSKMFVLKYFTIGKLVSLYKSNYCKYKKLFSKRCDKMHNFITMYRENLHTHLYWIGADTWACTPNIHTEIHTGYWYLLRRHCPRVFGPGYGPVMSDNILLSGIFNSTAPLYSPIWVWCHTILII